MNYVLYMQFGSGYQRVYKETLNRGTIGRARRAFGRWYNKKEIQQEEVAQAKQKRADEKILRKELAAQHWEGEKMKIRRHRETMLRKGGKG